MWMEQETSFWTLDSLGENKLCSCSNDPRLKQKGCYSSHTARSPRKHTTGLVGWLRGSIKDSGSPFLFRHLWFVPFILIPPPPPGLLSEVRVGWRQKRQSLLLWSFTIFSGGEEISEMLGSITFVCMLPGHPQLHGALGRLLRLLPDFELEKDEGRVNVACRSSFHIASPWPVTTFLSKSCLSSISLTHQEHGKDTMNVTFAPASGQSPKHRSLG